MGSLQILCCKNSNEDKNLTLNTTTGGTLETLSDAELVRVKALDGKIESPFDRKNKLESQKSAFSINNERDDKENNNDKDNINNLNNENGGTNLNGEGENVNVNVKGTNKKSNEIDLLLNKIEEEHQGYVIKHLEEHFIERRKTLFVLEREIEDQKEEILERISFQIELKNLDEIHHKNVEFFIEVLFASTEDLENCFTLGKTSPQKMSKNNSIIFKEELEFNFLFERTQYLRVLINSDDGKQSEVRINLAKVITSKLSDVYFPVNLLRQDNIDYTGNKIDKYSQNLLLKFKRKTHYLDKKISNFYVEFNFLFANQIANRLRYEIIVIKDDGEVKIIHHSNELMGKNPLYFSAASFDEKAIFQDPDAKSYVFEFYQNDQYYGQVVIYRKEMMKLITAKEATQFNVSFEGIQIDQSEHNKPKPKLSTKSKISSTNSPKGNLLNSDKTLKTVSYFKQPLSPRGNPGQSEKNTIVINPREYINGKVSITFKQTVRKKFYDLLFDGLNTAFDICIDYTSSNGDPAKESSLHTLKLENNKYAKAIKSCGNILKEYDDDQRFPVFGFGGVPENGKEVSHCFNINGKRDPSINGMDEVIRSYLNSLRTVEFVGPTYFQPVLKTIVETIKKEMKGLKAQDNALTYHVCLMLTDGKIEDMNETIDVLIEAAKLPISVIIVGIGNDDFGKMHTLDGNEVPLSSQTTGEKIYRDIVQFVNFSEFEDDGTKLAGKVLEAIPVQIEEYFRKRSLFSK